MITGGSGLTDHRGIIIDVRDSSGNIIGTLTADFAAQGYMEDGPKNCWGYNVLVASRSHVLLVFTPSTHVEGGDTGPISEILSDQAALDRILASIGKSEAWLLGQIAAGKQSWNLPGTSSYSVFFNSCQDYAKSIHSAYDPIVEWGD